MLHATELDFLIPNFNDLVKTDGYKEMQDELKNRLIEDLADEYLFVGMSHVKKVQVRLFHCMKRMTANV